MFRKDKIALIPIKGTITSEEIPAFSIPLPSVMKMTSSTEVLRFLEEIKQNKRVKAIVLEINSPGGTPFPCREIAQALKSIGRPTVAWVKEYATSGAYWVASATDCIVADSLSTVGSIGVASIRPDFSGLMKKFGIDVDTMSSGIHKLFGLPFKKPTSEEKATVKEEIETIQKEFIQEIEKNRKLSKEGVNSISSGKIFLGKEAKNLGLIDELGGKARALEIAKEKAGLKAYKIIDYSERIRKPGGLLRRLLGS